jgi:hypothetical protein
VCPVGVAHSHRPFVTGRPVFLAQAGVAHAAAGLEIRIENPALAPGAGSFGSEMRSSVLRADQPGLGVVALGDDSGEAPPDASQWTLCALRQVVVHGFSSVSSHLLAGHH